MAAKQWPVEVKATALDLFARDGGPAAEAATGVPAATIRGWAKRESARAGALVAHVGTTTEVVPSTTWRERRDPLTRDLGTAATETLAKVREAVGDGRLREAQAGAITLGILIDKAQLLGGGATQRSESFSVSASAEQVEARIAELEKELGYQ